VSRSLSAVTLVVRDYDEAIAFFTGALRFRLVEDRELADGKRWVIVAPQASVGTGLLLARAATPEQAQHVGNQTGGRVAFFLQTTDFWDDYAYMQAHGVRFTELPREEPYGRVVVFLDLYGNKWDLVKYSP
jgi:catechol 2,3-dioxygenase-like lactoylglutathione lyase family enzyme